MNFFRPHGGKRALDCSRQWFVFGGLTPTRWHAIALAVVLSAFAGLMVAAMPSVRAANIVTIVQKDRAFSQSSIVLDRGDTIRFTNEDGFLHQMFTHSATFSFESGEQSPGEIVEVEFPTAGSYTILCGIHPKMSLKVDVR